MLAARGPSFIEIDNKASEQNSPFGVITVDCSNPHEFDDAISVEPLPSAQEAYRVSVFAVDTSAHYTNDHILRSVLQKTESIYMNSGTRSEEYQPMLPEGIIKKLHFDKSKRPKSALTVSFVVGQDCPPCDVQIGFGHVDVRKNMNYKRFGEKCRYSPRFEKYGRASAYILSHLGKDAEAEDHYDRTIHVPNSESFRRGANINQSFMVAAGHVVAKTLEEEGQLCVYRVHDPVHSNMTNILSPRLAYFSAHPGRHVGLGLNVYTRVTSPLRRAEDFVMNGLLRVRHEQKAITGRDEKVVASTIQRLNQRIASEAFMGLPRMRSEDLWTISEEEAQDEADRVRRVLSAAH